MSDNETDLSNALIFCDSASGVYIPQRFAKEVMRDLVTGVSDEDWLILEAGPDHEHYWDAWTDVLDNAKINDPVWGECYLHQDEDLWVVPVNTPKPVKPETKTVLGHTFKPMENVDWSAFAGADEGSFICNNCGDDKTILILSPNNNVIYEIVVDNDTGNTEEFVWTKDQIR